MKRKILSLFILLSGICTIISETPVKAANVRNNSVKSDLSMVFQPGTTTVDFASSLNFNTSKISPAIKKSYAKAQGMTVGNSAPNYVQVSNFSGMESGWVLEAKQTQQFVSEDTNKSLTGAYINFSNGELVSISSDKKPSYYKKDFNLSVGANKVVVEAAGDEGFGTWVYRFGNEETKETSIALNIPRDTTKMADIYHSEIMWSLNNVPAND
ncbi:WxL domain-containing protein [Dellaglioa algida]|uniref:WxL domain-containing protein n=1 Tax=Dellaglioa algida TaxID=105612 RepID=UPI0024C48BBA|nr:WxL domain-containing protein [Dellaglioa algida]MDK1725969.1 WxL domain-containing protein [Dellaglioa algida]